MLILIMVLKFKSTDKFHRIRWRHHFEDNENMKLSLSWHEIVIILARSWNSVCRGNLRCWFRSFYSNSNPLTSSIEFDVVIILKTMKTANCLYVGNTVRYEVEIWYSKFLNGCQSGSACPWRVGTCQWRVDGDRRLSYWLDLLGAIRKIERRLNCVNVRSAFNQWEKRRNPSSTWNYVSTRKQQNTLQLPTIKKFAVCGGN